MRRINVYFLLNIMWFLLLTLVANPSLNTLNVIKFLLKCIQTHRCALVLLNDESLSWILTTYGNSSHLFIVVWLYILNIRDDLYKVLNLITQSQVLSLRIIVINTNFSCLYLYQPLIYLF